MEDSQDEKYKNIIELLKEIKKNKDECKKNKLDSEIINKINEKSENEKKNYLKLKFRKLFIVDKGSINKLIEELKYEELEDLLDDEDNDDDNDDNDETNNMKLEDKIKKLFKDKDFSKLKEEISEDLKIYNTEKEMDDIIKNEIEVILINENLLKILDIKYSSYKGKEVLVTTFNQKFNLIYFPKENFSLLINPTLNSSLKATNIKSEKEKDSVEPNQINNVKNNNINNINGNINNNLLNNIQIPQNNIPNISFNNIQTNQINIPKNENINNINIPLNNQFNNINNINNNTNNIQINNNINQNQINNQENIINSNNSQNNIQINMNNINVNYSDTVNLINQAKNNKLILDRNIQIVTNHIVFLNYIYNNLPSLNISDLSDITQIKNINYNNKAHIILMTSETFEKIGKDILYDECQLYLNININDKQKKYDELLQKFNQNNLQLNPAQIQIIKSFEDYNSNIDADFMFVNEDFCANIGMDKQQYINVNIFLFKVNNEIYLFFGDKNELRKVNKMNQYYKLSNYIGDMIDTPQEIVDNLIDLYKDSRSFNEYLTEHELNEGKFNNYYIVNKKWIDLYKKHYNFDDIYLKFEEQDYEEEDNVNVNVSYNNNNNYNSGSNKKKKKRRKKKKNRWIDFSVNNNQNQNSQKKKNNPLIKSKHKNLEIPKMLFDENNILPLIKVFKESYYPEDFELIENQTLKNICKSLNLDIPANFYEQISVEALSGSNIIILKRKDNSVVIFSIRGIITTLEYIIMFEDKNKMNDEINNIKRKGIEDYLKEKYLNFNDDNLQYIPNSENTSIVARIYICNKKQINYNLDNNNIYNRNYDLLNTIATNYKYSNFFNYKILPSRAGLDNIGATCYMNATLQGLCNVPQLQNFFLYNNELYQNPNAILSKAFGDVMRNLYDRNKNKNSYSPHHFKNVISEMNPLFKGIAANDSKDLILFLLQKMHEELNKPPQNYIPDPNISNDLKIFRNNYYPFNCSLLQKTFYYEMESKIRCCNCGFETFNYSAHNFIIFPLEKVRQYKIQKNPQGFIYVTLDDCFENQQAIEYLQNDSMIYCNGCRQMCVAENMNKMNTCPDILIIILNRGKGIEFDVEFDFPMRFDAYNYVIERNKSTQYELISVIVHTGGSDMSGHFYAYCKSNIDKNWYRYNDSIVDMLDQNYQITIKNVGLPYVLFYQNTSSGNNGMIGNNMNNINNIPNGIITLYFRLVDIEKELYLDVFNYDTFSLVIQKLAQKYNWYNFFNCYYYILNMGQTQIIDFNKTVQQNGLCDSSFINIKNKNK